MKLILCRDCGDVVKLMHNPRQCFCCASGGRYTGVAGNAEVWGPIIPIGFHNTSFTTALENQPESGLGRDFVAFVIPKECDSVKSIGEGKPKS
ncbi:hypothetical protein [Agaribacterium sp. ZY112]|uniref:hypothetical protein n=1 Tax=Agaribacterium sp. ZY112 TaxID=3233574 RepID=UPI003524E61D